MLQYKWEGTKCSMHRTKGMSAMHDNQPISPLGLLPFTGACPLHTTPDNPVWCGDMSMTCTNNLTAGLGPLTYDGTRFSFEIG